MVPGIDFAGVVEESSSEAFQTGDEVIVTGCGTSETMWGGYAEYARLNAEFMVPLPKGMTLVQAMGIGTAGFTAMQAVMALEEHGLKPGGREVLVTGAAGGVGGVAVAILAQLGYNVDRIERASAAARLLERIGCKRNDRSRGPLGAGEPSTRARALGRGH